MQLEYSRQLISLLQPGLDGCANQLQRAITYTHKCTMSVSVSVCGCVSFDRTDTLFLVCQYQGQGHQRKSTSVRCCPWSAIHWKAVLSRDKYCLSKTDHCYKPLSMPALKDVISSITSNTLNLMWTVMCMIVSPWQHTHHHVELRVLPWPASHHNWQHEPLATDQPTVSQLMIHWSELSQKTLSK